MRLACQTTYDIRVGESKHGEQGQFVIQLDTKEYPSSIILQSCKQLQYIIFIAYTRIGTEQEPAQFNCLYRIVSTSNTQQSGAIIATEESTRSFYFQVAHTYPKGINFFLKKKKGKKRKKEKGAHNINLEAAKTDRCKDQALPALPCLWFLKQLRSACACKRLIHPDWVMVKRLRACMHASWLKDYACVYAHVPSTRWNIMSHGSVTWTTDQYSVGPHHQWRSR